jgi:HemK-like putative methylase
MAGPVQEKFLANLLCDLLVMHGITTPMESAIRIMETARGTDQGRWRERALEMAQALVSGMPLSYVLGRQIFMNVELMVAPGALAPRPETEILGATAVELLRTLSAEQGAGTNEVHVIDMCCGLGNLACGIANAFRPARVWASDLSAAAVVLARCNVERLGLSSRIEVLQGNLFAALAGRGLEDAIDAIVCNPPYISSSQLEKEAAKLLRYEPREAFDGGPYGFSIYQRVVKDALPFLRADGWLMFEIGEGQDCLVEFLFKRTGAYTPVEFVNNAGGEARVAVAKKRRRSSGS